MTSDWFVDTIKARGLLVPNVFVETGTFWGENIPSKLPFFKEIHSIDLKEEYVVQARNKFPFPNVTFHHGDSAEVLARLVNTWNEPVVFYLDAHWSGGETAKGSKETPLLEEMTILGKRQYDDIIFIDDTRFFGKKMFGGIPGDHMWPYTEFDWRDVTLENILKNFGHDVDIWPCDTFDRIMLIKK